MIRRLLALSVGAALVVGGVSACGGDESEPGAGSGGGTAGTGGGAETSGSDDGGGGAVSAVKTCDGYERDPERAAPWPDVVYGEFDGPISSDCRDQLDDLVRVNLERESRMVEADSSYVLSYVLNVTSAYGADKVQDAHQVSVSNVEVGGSDGAVMALADVVLTDPSAYSDWLLDQRDLYEGAVTDNMTAYDYWEKAFGGPVAFEDMWLDVSRLGETVEIGPVYVPKDNTEADSWGKRWYFAFDESKAPARPRSLKFDLTIDGETKTLAFDLD
ncbi:MAG: hypothetical protein LBD97_01950 [Bifidobacteriaceae bacterium]|jgi:hypothetical protein|nr:hypothetical protein [Bifidobacteriaceae bacterium]